MGIIYSGRLTDIFIRKKAPQGKMYRIRSINFSNLLAVAGVAVLILDRWIPTNTANQDAVDVDTGDIMAHFGVAIDGWNENLTDMDHTTKFLSITKTDQQSVNCMVTIYGDLVNASRTQLILAWFRKGGL